jgi:hypothetical protein
MVMANVSFVYERRIDIEGAFIAQDARAPETVPARGWWEPARGGEEVFGKYLEPNGGRVRLPNVEGSACRYPRKSLRVRYLAFSAGCRVWRAG